jgi:hypothetical protein
LLRCRFRPSKGCRIGASLRRTVTAGIAVTWGCDIAVRVVAIGVVLTAITTAAAASPAAASATFAAFATFIGGALAFAARLIAARLLIGPGRLILTRRLIRPGRLILPRRLVLPRRLFLARCLVLPRRLFLAGCLIRPGAIVARTGAAWIVPTRTAVAARIPWTIAAHITIAVTVAAIAVSITIAAATATAIAVMADIAILRTIALSLSGGG